MSTGASSQRSVRPNDAALAQSPSGGTLLRSELFTLHDWRCAGHDTPAHVEEEFDAFELAVVRRGAFERRCEGSVALYSAGDLLVGNPGDVQRIAHPVPGGDACTLFSLAPALARSAFAALGVADPDRARPRLPTTRVALDGSIYLRHRLALAAARMGDTLAAEELGVAVLAAMLRGCMASAGSRRVVARSSRERARAREWAACVLEVIGCRYAERLTLAVLARSVGASPFHLGRAFRSVTGTSIHQALLRQRLHRALERILDTRESLSGIAFAHGFCSHSHFTQSFRREFGVPPQQVRAHAAPRRPISTRGVAPVASRQR